MEVLQFVVLTIFPDDTCFQYHGVNYSTTSHICVGVVGGGKGQCSVSSNYKINRIHANIISTLILRAIPEVR